MNKETSISFNSFYQHQITNGKQIQYNVSSNTPTNTLLAQFLLRNCSLKYISVRCICLLSCMLYSGTPLFGYYQHHFLKLEMKALYPSSLALMYLYLFLFYFCLIKQKKYQQNWLIILFPEYIISTRTFEKKKGFHQMLPIYTFCFMWKTCSLSSVYLISSLIHCWGQAQYFLVPLVQRSSWLIGNEWFSISIMKLFYMLFLHFKLKISLSILLILKNYIISVE